MASPRIILLVPHSDDPSPLDQAQGARLAAAHDPQCAGVAVEEVRFHHRDLADLERMLARHRGGAVAVVGATGVPESTRLGELAEAMGLLCFVANNNPAVWRRRRQVFHIGLPSAQTAAAVAGYLNRRGRRRVALVHDATEFQRRVASNMESALQARGAEASRFEAPSAGALGDLSTFAADLVYVVFSSEEKALPIAQMVRAGGIEVPLLFGRSLMRQSFLDRLDAGLGECWFVDMFSRLAPGDEIKRRFFTSLNQIGVSLPTTNHAFGWDGMSFCAQALSASNDSLERAVEFLESGVVLNGVTGACQFHPDNHNGRHGAGPTVITRWRDGQFEDV